MKNSISYMARRELAWNRTQHYLEVSHLKWDGNSLKHILSHGTSRGSSSHSARNPALQYYFSENTIVCDTIASDA